MPPDTEAQMRVRTSVMVKGEGTLKNPFVVIRRKVGEIEEIALPDFATCEAIVLCRGTDEMLDR